MEKQSASLHPQDRLVNRDLPAKNKIMRDRNIGTDLQTEDTQIKTAHMPLARFGVQFSFLSL